MPINLKAEQIDKIAEEIYYKLVAVQTELESVLADVNNDIYDKLLVNVPVSNNGLAAVASRRLGAERNNRIKEALDRLFSDSYEITDIEQFIAAYASLAAAIEANVDRFTPTMNATTKRIEYRTSPGLEVKNRIITRINAVLSNVA